jgi:hypothetical protein
VTEISSFILKTVVNSIPSTGCIKQSLRGGTAVNSQQNLKSNDGRFVCVCVINFTISLGRRPECCSKMSQ